MAALPSEPPEAWRAPNRVLRRRILGVAAVAGLLPLGWQPPPETEQAVTVTPDVYIALGKPAPPAEPAPRASAAATKEPGATPAPESSAAPAALAPPASDEVGLEAAQIKGWVVARRPTPLDQITIAHVLREAHSLEFGKPPTQWRLGVAWAHIALETARGKAIECNNLGNLTHWTSEPLPHYVRLLKERSGAAASSGSAPWRLIEMRFRAFDQPVDGARAYWATIRRHYMRALHLFDGGDGYQAGLKLARDGYATADALPYASAIANLTLEFRKRIQPQL